MTEGPRVDDLTPFERALFASAAPRLRKVEDEYRRRCDRLRAKLLAEEFGDHELTLLNKFGFLSRHDRNLMARMKRKVRVLAKVGEVT